MGQALGILVQPVMELRRGGKGRRSQPQNQHQGDNQNSPNAALTVCVHFAARLHAAGIKLPLPVPCKPFPGILMTTMMLDAAPDAG